MSPHVSIPEVSSSGLPAAVPAPAPRGRFVALHLGLLAVLLGAFAWRFHDFAIDDFFITFRYALNLAEGHGLRFNPDEAVFGTTAPGFALLLAALRALTGAPMPLLGTATTLVALLAICGLVLWEASAARPWEGVLAAWLLGGSSLLWLHAGGELLPVAALLMTAGHLGERGLETGRRGTGVAAGLLAGFAAVCRPDAALGVATLGCWLWWRGRRLPQRYGWPAAAVLAAGLLAARAWFGRFFPETLEAKRLQTRWMPELWPGGGDFWPAFLEAAGHFTDVLPLVVLGLAGAVPAFRRGGGAVRALLLWAAATVVAYPLLGVAMYAWYGIPLVMALTVGAAYAVGAAGRAALRYLEGPAPERPVVAARATALLLATLLAAPLVLATLARAAPLLAGAVTPVRLELYRQGGRWLDAHAAPDARVAAIEVGILGFYGRRHVHDLLGLVSPQALPHVARGDLVGAFAAGDPDYFVDYSPLHSLLDRILESPGFHHRWEVAAELTLPGAEPRLTLYRRRAGPAADGPADDRRTDRGAADRGGATDGGDDDGAGGPPAGAEPDPAM